MISIVVVTWQSEPDLRRLVASLNLHLGGEEELIVVDNASSDAPIEAAQSWKGAGTYLQMESNHGFGVAANAGVAEASNEGVVILNPDTELCDDGLSRLARLARDEGCLAGPRVLESSGARQPSASGPAVGIWPWVRALVPSPLGSASLLRRTAPWRLATSTEVSWLTGACIAGPASLLRELGPFDPGLHMYAEDLDLGLRAGRAGVRSVFAPELCTVVHHGKGSSSQRFENLGRGLGARNGRAVLARHYGPARARRAYRAERLGLELRVAVKRVAGRPDERQISALAGMRGVDREPEPIAAAPATTPPPFERARFGRRS